MAVVVETGTGALAKWRGLLRVAGWAALGSVALTVVQLVVFAIWPPVHTVGEVFAVMATDPVVGLLSLDALYIVNNVAVWLFCLGLGVALWPVSSSAAAVAIGLATLQMSAYFASNPALEMFFLGRAHAAADPTARSTLLAAGEAVLAGWKGTAFVTYYLLGAAVLLILAWLLRRTTAFGRSAAWWALASGLLMLVPSPFGTPGMVFAIASLLPWSVFCVLAGRRLLRLGG